MAPPLRILCVCTGNTCRSPMFAALLGRALARRGVAATVDSAGTGAADGDPASDGARRTMARAGLDLQAHHSRNLAGLDAASYDRVWCMTSRHAAAVRALGVPAAKLAVIAADRGGVPDPIGGDDAVYAACAAVLADEADRIAGELARG